MTDTPEHKILSLAPDAKREWLFDRSAGGIAVSGDSGSGKSVFLRQLLRTAIRDGDSAIFLFDPPGDLAKDVLSDCLDMGPSVKQRTYYFAPGNPRIPIGPINPLAVERHEGQSEYEYQSRLECKVLHAALLLLAAWGETDFDLKPTLFKWSTTILRSLAKLGMSIADAVQFLDVGSDLYHELVSLLPDLMAQLEFERLAGMKPSEQEEFIASTKNRFLGMLASPVMQTHLGVVKDAVNVRTLIEQKAIVIVDFEPLGAIHQEHTSILGNFWLSEVFHCVFNTPQANRLPVMVVCDELPVFRASAPLIANVIKQIRKMKARFVGAFQGTHSFPEGKDDPLLRSMIQCGTRFYFRHGDEDDATFFAGIASLPHLDPNRVKFEHWDKEQYQAGNSLEFLVDQSFDKVYGISETDATGEGERQGITIAKAKATGATHTVNASNTHTDTASAMQGQADTKGAQTSAGSQANADFVRTAYNEAEAASRAKTIQSAMTNAAADATMIGQSDALQNTETDTISANKAIDRNSSHAVSRNAQEGQAKTIKSQLVPILEWRNVLRFMEFLSLDDQKQLAAARIAGFNDGEAIMSVAGSGASIIQIPMTLDPFEGTPKFAQKKLSEYFACLHSLPFYRDPIELYQFRKVLPAELIALLRQRLLSPPSQETRSEPTIDDSDTRIGI